MVNKVSGKETVSLQPVEVNLAPKKKPDVTISIDTNESCLPFQPVEEVNVKSLVKKQPAQGLKRARTSGMTDLNTISAGVDVEIVDPIASRKNPRIKKPTKQLRRCSSRLVEFDSFSQNGIGCPQTRPSNELKRSQYLCSPYIPLDIGMKRMKGNKKATITKVNMDEESELDSDDVKCQKISTALDLLCATFNGPSIPKKSLPQPKPIPPHPLSSDEKVLVAYYFDKELDRDLSFSETIVSFAIDLATRRDLCSLKPGVWLDSSIITLVAVQLTSVQKKRHQDKCHTTWYLPTYISQRIINDEVNEDEYPPLAQCYFGETKYTGEIHACQEIYIPMNDANTHWFCLKLDMVYQKIYLLDSLPTCRDNSERKQMAIKLVHALHLMLQTKYGHFYVADVTMFDWITLEDPPIQDNSYDCGMFVIKHMQGIPLPNGVQGFDPLERLRLPVDLVRDPNNLKWPEISVRIEKYKLRWVSSTLYSLVPIM
ncbi:uncharacterized protein LOC131324836 isoform X1 [Rhododendron vialii]|uniref:uncharacterized protein LOC131324836 isoform X1 n=1 Tax=Rhododendron vialii TaxID=182163 RepID=UPI00265DB53D|nr:uncharacterized protein LOC131324836 isoform X1 [Rhododendron vialii]